MFFKLVSSHIRQNVLFQHTQTTKWVMPTHTFIKKSDFNFFYFILFQTNFRQKIKNCSLQSSYHAAQRQDEAQL